MTVHAASIEVQNFALHYYACRKNHSNDALLFPESNEAVASIYSVQLSDM
jgi:hypothetical protein